MLRRQGEGGVRVRLLEEVFIVAGLLLVQCVLSGYVLFTDHLLALGAEPLAVIVVAGAAFCLPFAVALERKRWPSKVSGTLVAQYLLIALGGCRAADPEADSEVKTKEDVPCRETGGAPGKGGREAWIEGPDRWVASRSG